MKKLILGLVTLLTASPLLHGAAAPAAPPAAAATAAKGTPIPLTPARFPRSESRLAVRSRTTIPISRLPGYNASLWTGIPALRAALANHLTPDPATIVQDYLGGINPLSVWNTPTAQVTEYTEYHDSKGIPIKECFWLDNHTIALLSINTENTLSFHVWNPITNTRHSVPLDCHASEPPFVAYSPQSKLFAIGTKTTVHLIDKNLRTHQTFSCGDVATYIKKIAWSPDGTGLTILANALEHSDYSPISILITYAIHPDIITTDIDSIKTNVFRTLRARWRPPFAGGGVYLCCSTMHYVNPTTVKLIFMQRGVSYWTPGEPNIEQESVYFNITDGNLTQEKQTRVMTSEIIRDEASHALLHIDGTIKDYPDQPDLYNIDYSITAYDSVTRLPQLTCTYTVGAKKNLTIHRIREALRYNAKQASPDLTKVVIIPPPSLLPGAIRYAEPIVIIEPVQPAEHPE